MTRRILPVAAAILLVTLAGCSTGTTTPEPAGPTTPQISVAEETPTSSASSDLETAASFVTAVYTDDWDQAGSLTADNTVAARYVAHQRASRQVDELNGTELDTDPSDVDVTPDSAAGTVAVEDRSGDEPINYVWERFAFEGGKVADWNVRGQAKVASRLWTTKASDSSKGVSADLVSAYQGNSKTLTVVVQLESRTSDVRVIDASYTADGGYKQQDGSSLVADVDKGGRALTKFTFKKAQVGGKLKMTIDRIDPDDNSSSYSLTTLELEVR